MKLGLIQEPDWELIGAVLARADDTAQATMLKAFVRECETWGTRLQVEKQMSFINAKLTAEERETLSMITYPGRERA
jgi:hypothetical protein